MERVWNLELGTWSLEFGVWSLELGAWNLENDQHIMQCHDTYCAKIANRNGKEYIIQVWWSGTPMC